MIRRDYLIVGAGIGGVSACEGIREHDKKGTIVLAGNETALPYHRSQLFPSQLGKRAGSAEQVQIHDAAWFAKNHIELRLDTLVTQINLERHIAVLANGQAIEFRKACMAMGSRARRPQVAGGNLGNVFYLRTLRDVQALREVVDLENEVAVIGGGCIALETAALLAQLPKVKVSILHRGAQLWARYLGPELGAWLADYYTKQGVKLMLNQSLSGFEGRTVLKNIAMKSGDRISAGLAIVALGAEPNLGLVAGTPLAYPHGTPVNEYLETDEKGIFAVGDIASYPDKIFGGVRRFEHWPCAVEQGHIAGANMSGKKRIKFDFLPHFSSTVFDLHFDFVGDFSRPATRLEVEGDHAKKKFAVRHFILGHLMGVTFCNQPAEKIEAAKAELRAWPRGKKAAVEEQK
ncbi:MAG: NAD(P)/FAD-dependent oxidoreductase [Chthoniobacter sp.]|nr:NAD(P)/FAD-dependent oxidoreductase [Chthoniobacter sp.]